MPSAAPERVARPAYAPEVEIITRPHLYELKRRVDQVMSEDELKNLLEDESGELLRNLVTCEPEVEAIQKVVNKYVSEVEVLCKSNEDLKAELTKIIEQYEERATQLASLQS